MLFWIATVGAVILGTLGLLALWWTRNPLPDPRMFLVRTNQDGDKLNGVEEKLARLGVCPDCEHKGFLAGPRGGMAQNFKCASSECGSRFNDMSLFGIERISDVSPDRGGSS